MREAGNGKKPAAAGIGGDISMEQTGCFRGFGRLAGRKHPCRKIDTVAVSAANKR